MVFSGSSSDTDPQNRLEVPGHLLRVVAGHDGRRPPIQDLFANGVANGLGEVRWFTCGLLALFGLLTGLMALAYLISAGIEIAGRFLWPRNPPDESELQ